MGKDEKDLKDIKDNGNGNENDNDDENENDKENEREADTIGEGRRSRIIPTIDRNDPVAGTREHPQISDFGAGESGLTAAEFSLGGGEGSANRGRAAAMDLGRPKSTATSPASSLSWPEGLGWI